MHTDLRSIEAKERKPERGGLAVWLVAAVIIVLVVSSILISKLAFVIVLGLLKVGGLILAYIRVRRKRRYS
jgi:UDP-N-acetylmuramyl pentapeptide phosphotransferase/UDP-N-acetylglucosamine-1-phosphate transferase